MDQAATERILQQLNDFWVTPELSRRGRAHRPNAAQVLFRGDGSAPIVHLDEEVVGLRTTLPSDREIEVGGVLSLLDVEFKRVDLPSPFQDCGHITVVYASFGAWLDYRFIYNSETARNHLDAARQFLAAAVASAGNEHIRAELDNLYSAAELAAKAFVLRVPSSPVRASRTHAAVGAAFNKERKLENVPAAWTEAFNQLAKLRGKARYLEGPVDLSPAQRAELRASVEALLDFATWWHSH